jgi:serine/threonine-protein kinase
MALVYRARDLEHDEPVAIKLLADNLAADPDLRRRFAREAELAARLSHPNVVRTLGSGEAGGRAFIVLEYVDGPNLSEELRRAGPLPPGRVADLGAQAAAALAHAHERGLVHRDVKPHNLLLAPGGTLKVSDFGIARVVDGTQLTLAGTVLGTVAYLAPEQAAGQETTGAADVYALGAVLYELLAGAPPYDAASVTELVRRRAEGEPPPSPSAVAPDVPPELDSLVLACLRDDPSERPGAREVEQILRGELEPPTRVLTRAADEPTVVMKPRRRRTRLLVAVAAVALAAIGLGLGLGLGGGSAAKRPAPVPPRIAAVPPSSTPAGAAENLAHWLRAHAR